MFTQKNSSIKNNTPKALTDAAQDGATTIKARTGHMIANGQINVVEIAGMIFVVIVILLLLNEFVPGGIEGLWKTIMSKVGTIV